MALKENWLTIVRKMKEKRGNFRFAEVIQSLVDWVFFNSIFCFHNGIWLEKLIRNYENSQEDVKQQTNIFHTHMRNDLKECSENCREINWKFIGNPWIHLSNFGQVFTALLSYVKIDDNLSKVFPGAKKTLKICCWRRLFRIFPIALWPSQTFEEN